MKSLSKYSFQYYLTKLDYCSTSSILRGCIIICELCNYFLLYFDSLTIFVGVLLFKFCFHNLLLFGLLFKILGVFAVFYIVKLVYIYPLIPGPLKKKKKPINIKKKNIKINNNKSSCFGKGPKTSFPLPPSRITKEVYFVIYKKKFLFNSNLLLLNPINS